MPLFAIARWALPLGFFGLGVVGGLRGGEATSAGFAAAAGLALGALLYYLLAAVGVLLGHLPGGVGGAARGRALQLDRQLVARSIRDVELDHDLGKLDDDQADELLRPLRERLARVDQDIERVADEPDPLAREILAVVEARVEGKPEVRE